MMPRAEQCRRESLEGHAELEPALGQPGAGPAQIPGYPRGSSGSGGEPRRPAQPVTPPSRAPVDLLSQTGTPWSLTQQECLRHYLLT